MTTNITVSEGAAGERLDAFLAHELSSSRSQVHTHIKLGQITLNGAAVRPSHLLRVGDRIEVRVESAVRATHDAPNLDIIYEDDDILVIDKPAGLTMHPGQGTDTGPTVADFARLHTADSDPERPGIVHRLDKDTSGLVVLAKTEAAKEHLQDLFRRHRVAKTYSLLVIGRPKLDEAVIRLPVDRDPSKPLQRAIVPGGREAVTSYTLIASYPGYSYIEARPQTGRTHQIRVHFSALGHPVAGDTTYGTPKRPLGLKRQFLHATRLQFQAPSGEQLNLFSPLPPDLDRVNAQLRDAI